MCGRLLLLIPMASAILLLSACTPTEAGKPAGKEPAVEAAPVVAKPAVAVDVLTASTTSLVSGIDVVGSLAPKYQAEVKSEYTGIVSEVFVTEWVHVKKGQPLARLDTREAGLMVQKAQAAVETAKAMVLQAKVATTRAQREFDRFTKMRGAGLVTQQNLDDAGSARDAALAQEQAARAQLSAAEEDLRHAGTRQEKALITAPMSGVVAMRGVNVGDLAGEMGSPRLMFLIVNTDLLDLVVTVPSAFMAALKTGQPLEFTTEAWPGETFTGTVRHINPLVEGADRSLKVQAEVRNQDQRLRGGLFIRGRIITGRRENVLQVPASVLTGWDVAGGRATIFLASNGQARRQAVATGTRNGDLVEITSGLTGGEQVISRGMFNLKDGDPIRIR